MTLKQKIFTIWAFFIVNFRRLFRDKTALFFTFLFPLIFLLVFGYANKNTGVSFKVAVLNQSPTSAAKQTEQAIKHSKVFKVDEDLNTMELAKEQLKRGQLDSIIVLPKSFGDSKNGVPSGQAQVVYTQNSAQAGQAVQSVLQAQFTKVNEKFVAAATPFEAVGVKTNEQSLTSFDYAFAGILGFTILGSGIFGPINIFPELKKMGILRRLHTTPLRVWQYFLSVMRGDPAIQAAYRR
jgi:ABC-2 type transport system permease protein